MIFVLSVTAMNLYNTIAVMLLLYGVANGAKEALRGRGDIVTVPENNSEENPSKVLALFIVDGIEESEETNPSMKNEAPMLPWIVSEKPKDDDEDSSGDSNSDENLDINMELDADSESNYYHEDDYLKDKLKKEIKLLDYEKTNLEPLRKRRWRSCQKTASQYCHKACRASYENACKEHECKRDLRRSLTKQCKLNCIDFFE